VTLTLTPPGPGRYGIFFEVRDTTQSPPRRVGERMPFSIQVIPSLSIEPDALVVGSGGGPTNAAQVKTLLHDLTSATWTTTSNFFAFDPSQDFYGAEVAVGNLDGVFPPEIIVAHGPQAVAPCPTCSPSADVAIYQKDLSSAGPPTFLGTLCPTPPFNTPRMGLSVAAGNVIPEAVGRQRDELLAGGLGGGRQRGSGDRHHARSR